MNFARRVLDSVTARAQTIGGQDEICFAAQAE